MPLGIAAKHLGEANMQAIPRNPMRRLAIAGALVVSSAAVSASLLFDRLGPRGSDEPVPDAALALAVAATPVDWASEYLLKRIFTGRVEAAKQSDLGFELAGLLAEVSVEEGDRARAGEVLARLDRARLKARRAELEAALANSRANLRLAEVTLERFENSVTAGAVTPQELDQAREAYQVGRAGVALAQARIAAVDVDLAKADLRAPFDGVVTKRLVDEGQALSAGKPVVEFQEVEGLDIRVGIAGELVEALQLGNPYTLHWRGQRFSARLRAVLPVRSDRARTVDALFDPISPPPTLRHGDLVELALEKRISAEGFWVPISALTEGTRGLWTAYGVEPAQPGKGDMLDADHRIVRRPVEILYQETERVYVRGAIGTDERILVQGLHRVVPGQLVRVIETEPLQFAMEQR
jgi:RND family efflux transporter MFP subunit